MNEALKKTILRKLQDIIIVGCFECAINNESMCSKCEIRRLSDEIIRIDNKNNAIREFLDTKRKIK